MSHLPVRLPRLRSPTTATTLAILLAAAGATAQEPSTPATADPRPLTVGAAVADSLAPDTTHLFALDVLSGRFVRGSVEQSTVDVVVTVRGPGGDVVGRFDGPARGPERFAFDAGEPGAYRLEVTPFADGTGRYRLVVDAVEPVASAPEARIAQLVAPFDHPDTPGGVVGLVEDGELVFARAFGSANLAYGIPFTVETPTNIGSTSKQFTAFAVSLLAERGALSLDDDVRTYIPELQDFGPTVTLRHLLTHTSGYREFLNLLAIGGRVLDHDLVERDELIDIVNRQPELQNAPGTEWNYNNTGFGLLAEVVARVGGRPFPEWMRENVFLPLGMESTRVREDPRTIVPGRAMGYVHGEDGGFEEAADLGGAMGAGGIYTTVGDLARWMGHLGDPKLGDPAIVREMTTSYVLADGDTTNYGLGLGVGTFRGLRRVQHGGADVAHRSTFVFFPGIDAGFVVLSNYGAIPGSIPAGVQALFVDRHPEFEEEDSVAEEEVSEEDAAEEGGGAEDEEHVPTGEELRAYAGRYFSAEVETYYDVVVEDGELVVRHRRLDDITLSPTGGDAFDGGFPLADVAFRRDGSGTVTGFMAGNGRTRDVWFERVAGGG